MKKCLTIKGNQFYLGDEEFVLKSGTIHYFRIHPSEWRERLEKLKDCGLNTVETYVPWNVHEPEQGKFCFDGMADLERFIVLAEELDLYMIVRPGPYICAEWEMGGFPYWLMNIKELELRTYNENYLSFVKKYFIKVMGIIKRYLTTNGGNIIAMQVENEFGAYPKNDKIYLEYLKNLLRELGCDVLLFTSDGYWNDDLERGSLDDTLMTVNCGSNLDTAFEKLESLRPQQPKVCMEFWNGWFDQWGVPHHTRNPEEPVREIKRILELGGGFNIYMFSGGTNFGFQNGSNCNPTFEPCITSYDYGAALSESGDVTEQYRLLKKLLTGSERVMANKKKTAYKTITEFEKYDIFHNLDVLGSRFESENAVNMEALGQAYGYILYEVNVEEFSGELELGEPRDRVMIYADDTLIGEYVRGTEFESISVSNTKSLKLLVENAGRVNYGAKVYDKKGLLENIKIGGKEVKGYRMNTLPFHRVPKMLGGARNNMPTVYCGNFEVGEIFSTFIKPHGFRRGIIFVNGFHLGRYYCVGPQQTLYVSQGILKAGENKIAVVDLYGVDGRIEFSETPILDNLAEDYHN